MHCILVRRKQMIAAQIEAHCRSTWGELWRCQQLRRATGYAVKAARTVEAASKVWQDYSLIILSYTKHQYIHQQRYD
jgi:hypothetical protein